MQSSTKTKILTGLIAILAFTPISALGASGDKAKVNGMINTRTGETLIVGNSGGNTTVVLDDSTKTRDRRGIFGLSKGSLSNAVLIPGLKVHVEGTSDDQGRIVAKEITVDGDDLETSEMIQAGLHPTAEQVLALQETSAAQGKDIATSQKDIAASQQDIATHRQEIDKNIKDIEATTQRFNELSEYDVKGEATVNFAVGKYNISDNDQDELKKLAESALNTPGYIIEVKGFTDSSGSAAMNDRLSEDRAKAVVSYLIQQCNVPIRHVVAPGAMGIYDPVASNETKEGRAENRRAEVKILVNKGIAGR